MTTDTPQSVDSPVRADLVFVPPELGRTLVRLIEQAPTDRATLAGQEDTDE